MPLKLAFRLDANNELGTGHLMRCLALADRLTAIGGASHFFCHDLPTALLPLLAAHTTRHLAAFDDIAPIAALQPDWLVIDHYRIDRTLELRLAPFCHQLLVIDDLANRPHHCHYLLDQGPCRKAADYHHLVPADCHPLIGADYALLRPDFRQRARQQADAWEKGLVCFGGADPAGACRIALDSLARLGTTHDITWTIVAGQANPDWAALEARLAATPQIKATLLRQSTDMPHLMAAHDFSIGAAGGMTWERACIGLPTLAVPIVDNQDFNAAAIAHFHLGELLSLTELADPALLGAALDRLRETADTYRQRGQALVDGLGLDRLASLIRPATTWRLTAERQEWLLWHADRIMLRLQLHGQTLDWQAETTTNPVLWQKLADCLEDSFSLQSLSLATPPAIPPPAPWVAAQGLWHLHTGVS